MFAIFVFLLILSVLIIVHEFGHFIIAKKTGVKVEQFSLGFGPVLFKKKKKGTQYSLSLFPLGGFVKMAGDNLEEFKGEPDEYLSQSPGKRFWIIFFGPLLNYILGVLFLSVIFFTGYPSLTTKVGGLLDGFGAQESGIAIGDKIVSIDGEGVEYWEELQKIVSSKKDKGSVDISLLRNGKIMEFSVRIKEKEIELQSGSKKSFGLLGITPSEEIVTVKYGMLKALGMGLLRAKDITLVTYKALGSMITGRISMRDSMTGPLGIFFITSKAARLGVIAVMQLMAILSLSLAIFNLLPFPILDGGHIALLAFEKIRGRPLGAKTERIINKVGVSFIIFIGVFVTYNDIVRNFGDKITKLFAR